MLKEKEVSFYTDENQGRLHTGGRFYNGILKQESYFDRNKTEWNRSSTQTEELTWQTQAMGNLGHAWKLVTGNYAWKNKWEALARLLKAHSIYFTDLLKASILCLLHLYSIDFFSIRERKSKGMGKEQNRREKKRRKREEQVSR